MTNESIHSNHACGRRIGDLLRQQGLLAPEELAIGLEAQRNGDSRPLGEILVERGFITDRDRVQALAMIVGRPFMTVSEECVESDALATLPGDFLDKQNLLPLSCREGVLTIAAEQFTDVFLADEIARLCGLKVHIVAATAQEIRRTRQQMSRKHSRVQGGEMTDGSLDQILEEIGVDDLRVVASVDDDTADLESHATESPIVKLVNFIIKSAVQCSASDIHLEPAEITFRVRYRIDGDLVPTIAPPLRLLAAVVSRIKILAGMDITERRLPQDGGMTVNLFDRAIDLRISTMTTKFGEKVVMRIVDRSIGMSALDAIGMPPKMLDRFQRLIHEPNGMVLVTGPTGSGKSTTLYGALNEMVSDTRNISTIEDPIERILPGVNQFQVHTAAGFTFAGALRSMLRQDPDVIMVGEIRDSETAKLATEAALTGHLVLSTLHTNDAPTAVPRLVNMGVEPYLVSASLKGVLAQRLCRRLCPDCAVPTPMTPLQTESMRRLVGGSEVINTACIGSGCSACSQSGTQGRIGVFDLLVCSEPRLSAMFRDRSPAAAAGRGSPFTGLLRDGVEKVNQGLISVESLLRVISHTEESTDDDQHSISLAA